MTETEIFNELKRIMSENFEIEADSITMDSNIVQDLDLDSIDAIDLIAEIQKILNCRFNAEDFKAVKTVGDIVRTVCAKVNSQC
ncbi:MAG: acyl carrier protein [Ruminobacter sp.]|jgi:acyl carrier protein|nr:acyl carrier protein [Ruminobacter sp.]